MSKFTFLTEEQIFGENQLDILSKYGTKCAMTDFSILLGGFISSHYYTSEGNTLMDRTGWWWTKSSFDGDARDVSKDGDRYFNCVYERDGGARPALPYSLIKSISSNGVRENSGIKEIEYGEYPQTIVDGNYSRELEKAYNKKRLRTTGKYYTTDSVFYRYTDKSFTPRTFIEYEYNGSKYIRFVGDINCAGQVLSDGRIIKEGQVYWVKIEPIVWLVDEKANIALSKKIIFSGVQFKNRSDYKGDFGHTDIKKFMDYYFSNDIIPSNINTNKNVKEIEVVNPYGFNFDEVSEEDIIKGAVESNVSVFLHGRSSEGKSARVKELDPDCEIIYMRNATPDSLNGKSVYNASTGEMIDIPPTWYTKVKEKCEKEKDKIHIVFFDELTNALPSIQGMAFNIILDGEVNGKWKLPENARIVAAGNDLNDSLAANEMAEPLFNRFAHVYINTTVDSWLKWAITPNTEYKRLDYKKEEPETKIHPAIYAYIAYKSYSNIDVLRTPYNGEKPNADPRKWEMASKVLYKTKKPEMLRSLIGEELTKDFIEFTKMIEISVEDVINGNYDEEVIKNMDISEKYATAIGLLSVKEENFEIVRNFMKKVSEESRAVFDSLWANGDEKRLELIASLDLKEMEEIKNKMLKREIKLLKTN